MKLIKGIEALKGRYKDVSLTIGNFDGVHLGHQKILNAAVSRAKEMAGTSMVLTFSPHPTKVLYPERNVRILTTEEEKARLIGHFRIDVLCVINFTREFAGMGADDFIRHILIERIGVKDVMVGHNYAFGRAKKGTTALLRRRGGKFGFGVKVIRNARVYGDVVSSSRIRSLILRGRVCEASLFLGRPYMITGTVIKGTGRGARLLSIPTANIMTPNEIIPKEGVYAVKVRLDNEEYGGVANIGRNPTFSGSQTSPMSYEVHIFNFSGDMVDRRLRVYFIDRIRDEKAFPSPSDLKKQIEKDIESGKHILQTKKHPKLI